MNKLPAFGEHPELDCDQAKIVILPVPFDQTSTWVKGADQGPRAILEASDQLEDFDIPTQSEVYLKGIYTDLPLVAGSPEELVDQVKQRLNFWLDQGKFPVLLGGEHSVSIGAFQAMAARYPGLSILQFDAHTDLRDQYHGSPLNHACVMARAKELCPIVQVGIRAMAKSELKLVEEGQILYAHQLDHNPHWMEQALERLSDQVYVTIDLDALDPSIMPSTGTPEPGGMTWYQITRFLDKLTQQKQVVGFDVVELCPQPANKAPDFLAAKLVYHFLSNIWR